MTRLARLAISGIVHRAVHDVAPGCGPLHPMRQLDAVPYQAPRVSQVAQAERVEMLTDRGDDLIVRQPDTCVLPCSDVRAVSNRSVEMRSISFSVPAS